MPRIALSRSAQAVLTAAIGVTESADAEAIAAAVLRAAAEQVGPAALAGPGATLWDKGFNEGKWAAYTRLNVIANELESLRCNS